jgi:TatD DNase family protein
MIDTHAHLDDKKFDPDRDKVIAGAAENGVKKIICVYCVSADVRSLDKFTQILADNDTVYAAAGIHPHDAKDADVAWKNLEASLLLPDILAIGEIGLDYHYNHSLQEAQKAVFRAQLRLASEKRLPVIIHSREAANDTIAALKEERYSGKAVMHCFSGSEEEAKIFLDMGFYLSIAGPVTFPGAAKLKEVVKSMPVDRMLIETDCPYLAPQAKRGMRNEPAYLKYTAEEIACLRGVNVDEIIKATTENAERLFKI